MRAVKWACFLVTTGSVGRGVLGWVGGGRSLAGGQGSAWEADMGGGKEWRVGLAASQEQSFCADNVSSRLLHFFLNK